MRLRAPPPESRAPVAAVPRRDASRAYAPDAHVIDVTHGVHPGHVLQGALVLANTLPYMPAGVHLASTISVGHAAHVYLRTREVMRKTTIPGCLAGIHPRNG